jgi:hypothetical protein
VLVADTWKVREYCFIKELKMDTSTLNSVEGTNLIVSLVIGVLAIIFAIVIWWRIFSKAGYSGALGLLMFVPIANLIVLCVLAFARWPIQREVDLLRQQAARGPQYSSSPQYPPYPQR